VYTLCNSSEESRDPEIAIPNDFRDPAVYPGPETVRDPGIADPKSYVLTHVEAQWQNFNACEVNRLLIHLTRTRWNTRKVTNILVYYGIKERHCRNVKCSYLSWQ
jgi:hypothetical protein